MERYKLIISKKDLYEEIELNENSTLVKIGTDADNDVRFRRNNFFDDISLTIEKKDKWVISCSDNLYISVGDVQKLMNKKLEHGDRLVLKYQESDIEIFDIEFVVDFDYEISEFNRGVDISNLNSIRIGGNNQNDIVIDNEYSKTESLIINKNQSGYRVSDNNSKFGVYVNGIRIEGSKDISSGDFVTLAGITFYIKNNFIYTTNKNVLFSAGLQVFKTENYSTHYKHPHFIRNTRVQYSLPNEDLEVQQPIAKPTKPKNNIITSLIPTLVMIVMIILLRGMMGGGGLFIIYSAVSMGIGGIMTIVSFIQDKKTYKVDTKERIDAYHEYVDKKEKTIQELREKELKTRNLIDESMDASINEVNSFGRRLFEKTEADKDFLNVFLGKGTVESVNQVQYDKQEFVDLTDPITLLPEEISKKYKYIDNAPIISDFNKSNGIGITGPKTYLNQLITNVSLDIAIKHFYNDVRFVYITNEEDIKNFSWIRWLHNVQNNELGTRNIVCDEESKNIILENLYNQLSSREAQLEEDKNLSFSDRYIVFVTDASIIRTHPLSKYIAECSRLGFTFVFFEEYEENIPQGCEEIIRLIEDGSGELIKTDNGEKVLKFYYERVDEFTANDIALKLGAITVDDVSLESTLTKNITLFEMLNIISVEDINLEQRWNDSVVYKTLSAPIGVKNKNEIVSLDISDKSDAHGPHGLVAGTTGSGKSEILQTYILSLVTLFHPYEVGFMIIDFKGGGMANQFRDLPHLMGTITNIDGREIERSLLSIKAELVKRQEMFSQANVNHIDDYIKLYKAGEVKEPMPHLIMIVDEFAELKSEYPDFMKELISTARIGRTLGVHLILATQKPSGVVDAQIWSNSKFKLCLKVQTKEDSNEVIKTPLAAEIVEPGRAYFQVGNNEILDLIQSAYSGAKVPEGNNSDDKIFNIYEKSIWGKRSLLYTNSKQDEDDDKQTQLDAIVEYVGEYCTESGIKKLPGICLPPLSERIGVKELSVDKDEAIISVPIGIYDDPEQQIQSQVDISLSKDNLYVVGSSQSGKTVLLQTMLYGLINNYSPEEVNLYLVDCGSMVLKMFEQSKHVGGVVLSNEEEKCINLFKMLNTIVDERKKVLSDLGIGNYSAYLEAGYKELPLIVVAIDNIAAFKEYFMDQYDELNSLTREAQSVGISFVITSTSSNALNYRAQANFGEKFVLNCNDDGEYSNVFGHCRQRPKEVEGRGLMIQDKRILEFQIAIFGDSAKETDRSGQMKEFIQLRNKSCDSSAKEIPMVPEKLVLEDIYSEQPEQFKEKGIIPIGMNYEEIELDNLNMNIKGSFSLVGNSPKKADFIRNILEVLKRTIVFHDIELVLVDDKTEPLKECSEYGFIEKYTSDTAEGMMVVEDYCDEISGRDEEDNSLSKKVLIINSQDVFRRICNDKNISTMLAGTIKRAEDKNAFVVVGVVENQAISFSSPDVLKTLKNEKNGLLFAQVNDTKFFEISTRLRKDTIYDSTMAYLFEDEYYRKIKLFE